MFWTVPGRWEPATVVLGVVAITISVVALVVPFESHEWLFELSILAVLPLVIAVAITGGVQV